MKRKNSLFKRIYQHRYLYLLSSVTIIYFVIFRYGPMWGLLMAFQKFSPFKGFWASEWVGLKNFTDLFANSFFLTMLRNTFVISFMKLILFFPLPILLSLMLNEVKHKRFKALNQTVVYFPHFISWVVTVSLTFFLLSSGIGVVNKFFYQIGIPAIPFLVEPKYFWLIIVGQTNWKETGYGTIIFLSAISAIDQSQYEAAEIDGATRMQRIWHVTLPSIMPTIIILLILRLGQIFDVGFEQILLMYNPSVRDVAEIFDTYAYRQGIAQGLYSIGVAVGLFKGLVGLVFLLASNKAAKYIGSEGIF